MVVDLPVEEKMTSVAGGHRLASGREVDDGEPPEREHRVAVHHRRDRVVIRAAVRHRRRTAAKGSEIVVRDRTMQETTDESTHGGTFSKSPAARDHLRLRGDGGTVASGPQSGVVWFLRRHRSTSVPWRGGDVDRDAAVCRRPRLGAATGDLRLRRPAVAATPRYGARPHIGGAPAVGGVAVRHAPGTPTRPT